MLRNKKVIRCFKAKLYKIKIDDFFGCNCDLTVMFDESLSLLTLVYWVSEIIFKLIKLPTTTDVVRDKMRILLANILHKFIIVGIRFLWFYWFSGVVLRPWYIKTYCCILQNLSYKTDSLLNLFEMSINTVPFLIICLRPLLFSTFHRHKWPTLYSICLLQKFNPQNTCT